MESELKEGFYLKFTGDAVPSTKKEKFYKATALESLNWRTGDESPNRFSAVTSGSSSGYVNMDPLEPDEDPMHLFYVIPAIRDGLEYQVKIPSGTDRMGLDDQMDIARLDNIKSPYFAPNEAYAFYLLHDMFPAFNALNITPETITPRIYFSGEKYALTPVQDAGLLSRLQNFEKGIQPYVPFKLITLGGID